MKFAITLLLVALCYGTIQAYDNTWDGPLQKECSSGQAFYKWYSKHDNGKEDRLWTFYCRSAPSLSGGQTAQWYSNVNDWDGILNFKCSDKLAGSIVCGVKSNHDNHREDRRWSFKCCKPSGTKICSVSTTLTGYVNDFDRVLSWQTPSSSQFMVGYYSYHNNHAEDRRWKVYYGTPSCSDDCACSGTYDNDWEVKDVRYDLSTYKVSSEQPEVVATKNIDNYSTKITAEIQVDISTTVTETSSFSNSVGASIEVSSMFKAGVPLIGETENTITIGASYDHTWGKENSIEKAVTASFKVTAPPNTHGVGKAMMSKRRIDNLPFTMTMRHKVRGCQCTVKGMWHGVEHYNLNLVVEDKAGHEMNLKVLEK